MISYSAPIHVHCTGGTLKDASHEGDGHAVVADGDTGLYGLVGTIQKLFSRSHAATALDGHGILMEVVDGCQAGHIVELDVFARELADQGGQFHTADVATADLMGARLQHQDLGTVLESGQLWRSLEVVLEVAAQAGQQDAEAGQRHLLFLT